MLDLEPRTILQISVGAQKAIKAVAQIGRAPALAWLCVVALGLCTASAQEPPASAAQDFDLESLAYQLGSGSDPVWRGEGGFEIAPDAVARVFAGAHAFGDVFMEMEVVPRRTARLAQDVALADAGQGARRLAAGTLLYADNIQLYGGSGQGPFHRMGPGALLWCTLDEATPQLCISRAGADAAAYHEREGSERRWRGPAPLLREEPLPPSAPFIRRYAVVAMHADGAFDAESTITRAPAWRASYGKARIPANAVIRDEARMPGVQLRLSSNPPDGFVAETF